MPVVVDVLTERPHLERIRSQDADDWGGGEEIVRVGINSLNLHEEMGREK